MDEAEHQRFRDEEHLRLLRIGYIVVGCFHAAFSFFPLLYVALGVFFASAGFPSTKGQPDPRVLGWVFACAGIAIFLLLAGIAALQLFTARALRQRRHHTLCFVTAGLTCLGVPYGTLLGIFTFLVIGRPSVEAMFPRSTPPSFPATPPPGPPE